MILQRLAKGWVPLSLAMWLASCGSDAGAASGDTARVPERSGDVWEIERPDDRTTAPGAMLAYLHGLHVVVLDGDNAYAGMTRLRGERDADGTVAFILADGLTASLTPVGEGMELGFSTGETVTLMKRGAP